jgi:hypothetical protein
MSVKNPKITLKGLQIELNVLREELKLNKRELVDVKEELKNVKDEIKKEKETTEDPKVYLGDKFTCKICDLNFSLKKTLKKHNQTYHTPWIKCKSCDNTFEKTCDLEFHIKVNHDSVETIQCDKCDKTFALEWRFKKHQEIHTNKNIRKCHYFNNQKCCPFEVIGCMFDHSLSAECKYGEKCKKKLCSFQHKKNEVPVNKMEGHFDEIDKPFETSSDGEKKDVDEIVDENVQDEEYFELYVEHNFSEVHEKFIAGKGQIE